MERMQEIGSVREAKDYLAGRIADEAKREHIPLSKIEREMLYFSETESTLPGMLEINAEFERDYDSNEYERKIAVLIRKIEARDADDEQEARIWDQAVDKLADGHNYLSIMLDPSFSPKGGTVRPPHDRLKLWLAAFGVVFGAFGSYALLDRLFGPKFDDWISDRDNFGIFVLCLIGISVLIKWRFGRKLSAAVNRLFGRQKNRRRAR